MRLFPDLRDLYDPAWRLPDNFAPVGAGPEDILYAMLAARAWDARAFGLCTAGDVMDAREGKEGKEGKEDLLWVIALQTFNSFTWEHDFAGYDAGFSWDRRETLKLIDRSLKAVRRIAGADETIVLVAGPWGDSDDEIGPPLVGRYCQEYCVRIGFPRIIGIVAPLPERRWEASQVADDGEAAGPAARQAEADQGDGEDAGIAALRARAVRGDAEAQADMGELFEFGVGVPVDALQAAAWYRRAAERGCARAQRRLGKCFEDGTGVPKDAPTAAAWYRKSAEQGDDWGQYLLGWCLEAGTGVKRDRAQAVEWYRKSAEQGNIGALEALGRIGDGKD